MEDNREGGWVGESREGRRRESGEERGGVGKGEENGELLRGGE